MEIKFIEYDGIKGYSRVMYNDVKDADKYNIEVAYNGKDIKALLEYLFEQENKIDKANELLSKIVVCEREDENWGAVKNTRKQDVYKTIWKLYEILDTSSYERNEMLKILGDKE